LTSHVKVVGILAMVWGGLMLLLAVVITCFSPLMFLEGEDPFVIVFGLFMALGYAAFGAGHLAAGWLCQRFRARIFVLSVLATGLFTCPFCGPLSLALPIYGFIVLLNRDVEYAFMMGEPPDGL